MEGGVLCLLVALRPRLELRYQPVTLPKLNVVPTTNFFPASQAGMYCNNGEAQVIPPLHRGPATCLCSFAMATSAAVARSSTNPSPHPFSWGRAFRIRSTGISVVPCPRGATLGSRSPAAGASRSFGLAQFSGTRNARQFKAGERGLQHPTRLAGNGLRAGGLCNRARPEHRHR